MKVVKASEVPTQEQKQTGAIDPKLVAELTEKFDAMKQVVDTKKYSILLDKEQTNALLNEFYPSFQWKGYESYAVAETYNQLKAMVTGDFINSGADAPIIEAIFHFLKNYVGTGVSAATSFRSICDQFAIPMQEINNDRQTLKDIALELTAAEKGITVESLVNSFDPEKRNI
jgi:hypothetical protein